MSLHLLQLNDAAVVALVYWHVRIKQYQCKRLVQMLVQDAED